MTDSRADRPGCPIVGANMDAVGKLLQRLGWTHEGRLELKDDVDRHIFRNGIATMLVGPLWTTHYRKIPDDGLSGLDSVRTEDLEAVEQAARRLMS